MRGTLTVIMLMMYFWSHAQEDSSGERFTLDQCIQYALNNSVDAKNAKLDREIASARVKETIGIGLPQVNGSVSVQQSPTLPRFFSQYDPDANFLGDFSGIPGIEPGDVVAAENFFQLKGAGDANLSINQLIFNGSYIVGLRAANAFKDLAIKEANQTDEQIIMNVSKAFFGLLINRERLELVKVNLGRLDSLYRDTEAMYKSGFAEKLDVDRLRVNRINLEVSKTETENVVDISLMLLKFQMNYPFDKELNIEGSIEKEVLQTIEVPEGSWDYSSRPDYQVMAANRELQKLNIKNRYAEGVPVLSAFANLGYSTQSPTFGGIFTTNSNFSEVEGAGPDKWYGYSTLGLRLSWRLFTGGQGHFQIQQEKLSLAKIENNFEKLEQSIDMEIEQSQKNLSTALEKLGVQRENMELAKEIFNTTEVKYLEGVGSNLEVVEADNTLKEAQTNYYNALYDAIVAQLELKKALGILK